MHERQKKGKEMKGGNEKKERVKERSRDTMKEKHGERDEERNKEREEARKRAIRCIRLDSDTISSASA